MEKEGLEVSLEAEPTKTEEIKMTTLEPEPEEAELLKRSGTPVTEQPGPSSGGYVGKFVSLPFSPSLSESGTFRPQTISSPSRFAPKTFPPWSFPP